MSALDAKTGSTLWEFPVRGGGRFSIPGMVVVDQKVFVRWSGILHALSGTDGAELWRNESGVFRLVTDGEGGVYVSAQDELARIDPVTGEIRWRRGLEGIGALGLTAGQGMVCSHRSPIVTLACYDGSDGDLLWKIGQLEISHPGGTAILGGRFVVEVDDEWIGLDLKTGSEVWRRSTMLSLDRAKRADGVLYACRVDCLALRATDGSILWRIVVENPSRPEPSKRFVFVVAGDRDRPGIGRRLLVLDPASGSRLDGFELQGDDFFRRVLDYEDGRLFLSARDDIRAYRYP